VEQRTTTREEKIVVVLAVAAMIFLRVLLQFTNVFE